MRYDYQILSITYSAKCLQAGLNGDRGTRKLYRQIDRQTGRHRNA